MSKWCDACQNTGWLTCHCGGDNCVCENNGEYPCPHCDGDVIDDDWGPEPADARATQVQP